MWSRVCPAYIYAVGGRINVRTKEREPFRCETAQEKQRELSIMLDGLKDPGYGIATISSEFGIEKHSMRYFYMTFDIGHYINDCSYFISSATKVVKGVIQCIGYVDRNNRASCDEFYSDSYEYLDDDQETLDYLNELCTEGIDANKDFVGKSELLALSPKELYQPLVSKK